MRSSVLARRVSPRRSFLAVSYTHLDVYKRQLSEGACWTEEARAACGETIPGGLGALPGSPEAAAFAEVSDALAALARLHPFGIEDHELVSV